MCTTQRVYRCSEVQMEAFVNSDPSRYTVVAKYSMGFPETQSLFLKQPCSNKCSLPLGASSIISTPQDVSTTPLIGDEKIGVLLLNLGGPETLEDVQPFLFNLFADPVIALCLMRVLYQPRWNINFIHILILQFVIDRLINYALFLILYT